MNESLFLYVDDGGVAVRDDGVTGIVWVDNQRKDVFFRSYTDQGRAVTAPVDVSRSPDVFSWLPRVVMGPGPRVSVLWQEIVFSGGSHGGEIFFARSDDGGRSFSAPLNLSNSAAGDGKGQLTPEHWHNGSLDLVRGPDGALLAAWTAYEGTLFFSRSTDGGNTWSAPRQVAGDSRSPARAPALATARDGTLYLAWTVGRDPTADIRIARSTDAGQTFGAPSIVPDDAGYADAPKIAVDGVGTLHLSYSVSRDAFFGPHQVRYTQSKRQGGWETPRVIAGPPATSHGAGFPALALDRAGTIHLVWEHHPEPGGSAQGLGFARSRDGGASFSPARLVPGTSPMELGVNGSRQGKLTRKLDVGVSGLLAVVDSRFREGERSVVRLILGR